MCEKCGVTIGKFDGIHLGHQWLIQKVLDQKKFGLEAVVVIIEPQNSGQKVLMPVSLRKKILKEMGIDRIEVLQLDDKLAQMSPGAFVEKILIQKFHASYVCAGYNFRFGKDRRGDIVCLGQMGLSKKFAVEVLPGRVIKDQEISSTWIRQAVEEGNMLLASQLLGRPFFLEGIVKSGNHIGQKLGFPTANIIPQPEQLLPPNGVYISRVKLDEDTYMSITNIGCRPTVTEDKSIVVETNLFDCTQVLYGKTVRLELLEFMRPEVHFPNREVLQKQVQADIASAKAWSWMHKLP